MELLLKVNFLIILYTFTRHSRKSKISLKKDGAIKFEASENAITFKRL